MRPLQDTSSLLRRDSFCNTLNIITYNSKKSNADTLNFISYIKEARVPIFVNNAAPDRFDDRAAGFTPVGAGESKGACSRKRREFLHIQHNIFGGNAVRHKTPHAWRINDECFFA
jgi:hypothetical protein